MQRSLGRSGLPDYGSVVEIGGVVTFEWACACCMAHAAAARARLMTHNSPSAGIVAEVAAESTLVTLNPPQR